MSKQQARIIGMYKRVLTVRSIHPKESYNQGGDKYGLMYEWGVNHYTFTQDKQATMDFYGLTEEEYNTYESSFTHKYDREKEEWYEVDIIDELNFEDEYDEEIVDIIDGFSGE